MTQEMNALFGAAAETNTEFAERFSQFAVQAAEESRLDAPTRALAVLACLLGCQGVEAFERMIAPARQAGVTAAQIREVVYQATAYLGIGRVLPFVEAADRALARFDGTVPQAEPFVPWEERQPRGTQAQVEIFGDGMQDFWRSGPEDSRHINRWLAENCFGDYYTRPALDLRCREMLTFCYLAAQGGCEPQLISHAAANLRMGNDVPFLIGVISACLPYIGYPRSLNALQCVRKAAEQ